MKPNRLMPRHIIIKLAKVKEKILKEAKGKKILYKETSIRISVDFSTETAPDQKEMVRYI